jgi:hypothetical protein
MKNRRPLVVGLALVLFGATGCGPDIDGLCADQEACLGGNQADIDACIVAGDAQREIASDVGCTDEFDTYFECTRPLLECVSAPIGGTCMSDSDCPGSATCDNGSCAASFYGLGQDNQDKCEAEAAAYNKCRP